MWWPSESASISKMILWYRRRSILMSAPMPQPSADTRSCSSVFDSTFCSDACSVLSTLPRNGRIACVLRSRPCLAVPPADWPSTMNSSLLAGSVDEQSASLPGRLSRCETAVLPAPPCAAGRVAFNDVRAPRRFLGEKPPERGRAAPVEGRLRLRAAEPLLGL